MKTQKINLCEPQVISKTTLMTNDFKFTKDNWIIRLLIKWLSKLGWIAKIYLKEEYVNYRQTDIDFNNLEQEIRKQYNYIYRNTLSPPTQLLIGQKQFENLKHQLSNRMINYPIDFKLNELYGMQVKILPWLDGMLLY